LKITCPVLLLVLALAAAALAAPAIPPFAAFTEVTTQDIDPAVFRQWVDGVEGVITPAIQHYGMNIRHESVWTRDAEKGLGYTQGREIQFGDSSNPGPRHLRVGFTRPVPVGTILGWATSRISVLKSDAPYPGNLADDSQWIPAERIESTWNGVSGAEQRANLQVTTGETGFKSKLNFWVLPPGTVTRAIRFTHVADRKNDGTLAGSMAPLCVLKERCIDAAVLSRVQVNAGRETAHNVISTFEWQPWRSNPDDPNTNVVAPETPDWLVLAWPQEKSIRGVFLNAPNFLTAEIEVFTGAASLSTREIARSGDWKLIRGLDHSVDWVDFGGAIKTRAVRLRITRPIAPTQNTVAEHRASRNGKLVSLFQLTALTEIGDQPLASLFSAVPKGAESHPPIPVQFTLAEPGYVTLVIEDSTGKRVRNLVSETPYPAGKNTVWWDGMDDLKRDGEAAAHSIDHVFGDWVAPGTYTVRGLFRKEVTLRYQMSVNDPGTPPWIVGNNGGWLAEHSPPNSVVFLPGEYPQIAIGSGLGENAHDFVLTDLDGRKVWGTHFMSGVWRGVGQLARDVGDKPALVPRSKTPAVAYAGLLDSDKDKNMTLILTAIGDNVLRPEGYTMRPMATVFSVASAGVVAPPAAGATKVDPNRILGGMAARNGIVAITLASANKIVFVDVAAAKVVGEAPIEDPRGLAFDSQGRLLVLSGRKLLRYAAPGPKLGALVVAPGIKLGDSETLVTVGLEDPCGLALDSSGTIYLTDWGQSHQVKVFDPQGKLLRTIGHAGIPKAGLYDRLHMNNPKNVTVDSNGRVWVAEENLVPKRISVWNTDGTLWKAFYGPDEYAGGGSIDPKDKTLFYYRDMQWKLDWEHGTSEPIAIYSPPVADTYSLHSGNWHWLDKPVYYKDRLYLTDSFGGNVDAGGSGVTLLFQLRNGVAVPVAAVGRASAWPLLLGKAFCAAAGWGIPEYDFGPLWPPNLANVLAHPPQPKDWWGGFWNKLQTADFVWNDLNGDGKVEPPEVTIIDGDYGPSFTLQDDLSVISSYGVRIAPLRFTDQGAPVYDITKGERLIPAGGANLGAGQALIDTNGWIFMTTAPKPFPGGSVGGTKDGKPMWSYPDLWSSIHGSHNAPQPTRPGQMVGTTHLLGGFVTPKNSDAGPICGLNANLGCFYLFTSDGLFVATLFRNTWERSPWAMRQAVREMDVTDTTHWTEDFLPTINQTEDGTIYVVATPQHSAIIRVDGLESVRRIAPLSLSVTPALLAEAQAYNLQTAADLIKDQGRNEIDVAILKAPPTVDGKLDDWAANTDWATIDLQTVTVNNFGHNTVENRAALAICGDRLYAAFQVHNSGLLVNTAEDFKLIFKTGGALDLMIGTDPTADPKRVNPVKGDIRLLVTQHDKKIVAAVFRAVVPGTKNPVSFSSPSRTITLDVVDDVSGLVELAEANGNYEMSIPLAALGLHPSEGQVIRGDLGILRGNGFQTIRRSYWQNKATGLVADVPGEAQLTPQLWGSFKFTAPVEDIEQILRPSIEGPLTH